MLTIKCCLWFNQTAKNAVNFYKNTFGDLEIEHTEYYTKAGSEIHQQSEGTVMTISFKLWNQDFIALNGNSMFKHSPSFSNFVYVKSTADLDKIWNQLTVDGTIRMPLNEYPWSKKYGWVADQYGVEWQLMLSEGENKIVPAILFVDSLYGKGQQALDFYLKSFPVSKLIAKEITDEHILFSQFKLYNQEFILMEGAGAHGHVFSESYSIVLNCETQAEIDQFWTQLTMNGGQKGPCGWLKDSFGISWQVVPKDLSLWLKEAPQNKKEKLLAKLMDMEKLNIAELKLILD